MLLMMLWCALNETKRYTPRLVALPAVPGRLLAHLRESSGIEPGRGRGRQQQQMKWSSKVQELLDELASMAETDATAKVVVFSSIKTAVQHLSVVLAAEGIGHTKIIRGDTQLSQQEAVHRFNTDSACRVLVLHAGVAAAGLTLTVARTVVLMEPFLKRGEELQAFNRCHRIGQTRSVRCVVMYCAGTVEERLLAYRTMEQGSAGNAGPVGSAGSAGGSEGAGRADYGDSGAVDADIDAAEVAATAAAVVGQLSVMSDGTDSRGLSRGKVKYVLGLKDNEDLQDAATWENEVEEVEDALDVADYDEDDGDDDDYGGNDDVDDGEGEGDAMFLTDDDDE